jgi:hypothetical protein
VVDTALLFRRTRREATTHRTLTDVLSVGRAVATLGGALVRWPRAFTPDLELSAFAFVSLLDGSVLSQVSASYYVSDAWTASAFVSGDFGAGRTERGSFPQRENVILQVTRYF